MEVRAGRPDLEPAADLAVARATLEGYVPRDEPQSVMRRRILDFLDAHPIDAHRRTCLEGHLTASVLMWDADAERLLLHHHLKLDRWLQVGGHCDGDANLAACAWRETVEESGIEPAWMSPEPVDLDVHLIPERPGRDAVPAEPAHLHLDVRYLALAPPGAEPTCSEESHSVRWFLPAEALALSLDASLERLLPLIPDTDWPNSADRLGTE